MVSDFALKRGLTIVKKNEIAVRWVANLIATKRAIEAVKARKIITFHSRVRLAKAFASPEPRGIAWHLQTYSVRHVNGMQSSAVRGDIMCAFADAPKAILTNARCLTEGVNIPAIDMVAFVDPRHSRVDITQAVGRAMRKPRGPTQKKFGYVVVPLFAGIAKNDSIEKAVESEKFDVVADVVNALQEHDEELVDIIREIKERQGAGKPFNPRRLIGKVKVIGPRIALNRLTTSISIEIADRIGRSWDEWYGRLKAFKKREGHCRVSKDYEENGLQLGYWVTNQRAHKDRLSDERRQRLDDIGFDWSPYATDWEQSFAYLKAFKKREGHCRVLYGYKENGFALGQWVGDQRANKALSWARRQRLDEIGFVWDPHDESWDEGFRNLMSFKKREGHCLVSARYKENSFALGQWVTNQRVNQTLSGERRRRLNKIGFVWDPFAADWDEAYLLIEGQSRLRESAQGDKWSFCLTAGKIWPANQERA
jgi:hypothetical protein